jgi:hypothetical protein
MLVWSTPLFAGLLVTCARVGIHPVVMLARVFARSFRCCRHCLSAKVDHSMYSSQTITTVQIQASPALTAVTVSAMTGDEMERTIYVT